jgi:hypothetical protein
MFLERDRNTEARRVDTMQERASLGAAKSTLLSNDARGVENGCVGDRGGGARSCPGAACSPRSTSFFAR